MMFRVLAGICLCLSFVKAHDNEHSPRFRRSIYEVIKLTILCNETQSTLPGAFPYGGHTHTHTYTLK